MTAAYICARHPRNIWHARALAGAMLELRVRKREGPKITYARSTSSPFTRSGRFDLLAIADDKALADSTRDERRKLGFGLLGVCYLAQPLIVPAGATAAVDFYLECGA